jgi:hypothetical protein
MSGSSDSVKELVLWIRAGFCMSIRFMRQWSFHPLMARLQYVDTITTIDKGAKKGLIALLIILTAIRVKRLGTLR